MYSREFNEGMKLPPLRLPVKRRRTPLNESKLKPYMFRHKYLERRGISESTQRLMGVGYDRQRKAVTMPWRLPDGRLANIKYRKVDSKIFWYEKGGWPVWELVYGMDVIYRKMLKYAVLCEAEIDAMSFMSAGVPAVAIGGSKLTRRKSELLKQSPIEKLYIATDNDSPGEKLRADIKKALGSFMQINDVFIPKRYKDANEAHCNGTNLKQLVNSSVGNRTLVLL